MTGRSGSAGGGRPHPPAAAAAGDGPRRVPAGAAAVEAVADAVLRRPPSAGVTRVVAVDGRAGAGKSTLARPLAARLGAPLVALEDLYGGWTGLEAGIDRLLHQVLEPLAAGRGAAVPEYDWWRTAWRAPWPIAAAPRALVVEGVGAGAARLREHLALLVWVEVSDVVRSTRALDRDDGLFTPFWDDWAAQEATLLARDATPAHADVVVDGDRALPARPAEPVDGAAAPAPDPPSDAPASDPGAAVRHAARVLLLDADDRVLLLLSREPATGALAWLPPGGGVEPGEPAAAAARREVWEETGLADVALGPEVWRRGALVRWGDALLDSRERWWLARVEHFAPAPAALTEAEHDEVLHWKWWTLADLAATAEPTVPRDLAARLGGLLRDGPPARPAYLPT